MGSGSQSAFCSIWSGLQTMHSSNSTFKSPNLVRCTELLGEGINYWLCSACHPYRRWYSLYRSPGTDKSSLSLSIAEECDLDVYILSITGVDDNSLRELFAELRVRINYSPLIRIRSTYQERVHIHNSEFKACLCCSVTSIREPNVVCLPDFFLAEQDLNSYRHTWGSCGYH